MSLIKGETEVKKDIEWLKGKINAFQEGENMFTAEFNAGVQDALEYVQELINQLDEPEVLSLDWIDEHEQMVVLMNKGHDDFGNVYSAGTMVKGVPSGKLENLLVPKQEELESKIKVLIEAYKKEVGAYSNPENGWIDGFIIDLEYLLEKEQKYFVEDNKHTLLCKWESSDGWKVISTIEATEDELPIEVLDFGLTEQEIKDYDPRYWAFAKPVEELEE